MRFRLLVMAACSAFLLPLACDTPPPGPDGGTPDAGPPDAGTPDAGPPDGGAPDAGPPDAGGPDAGPPGCGGRPCSEGWSYFTQPFAGRVLDIDATSPGNIWALVFGAGSVEYTAHWDGGAWASIPLEGTATGAISTDAIWTAGPGIAFVAGRSVQGPDYYSPRTFRFDGGAWEPIPISGPVGTPLLDLWGSSPTDLWTVGYNHFHHGDGTGWTPVTAPLPAEYDLDAIHGTAPDNVWTVGNASSALGGRLIVLRLDGGTWEDLAPARTGFYPTGFWVAGRDEAWVVAETSARALHRQGGAWTEVAIDGGASAVWGAAPDDVWFAGAGGLSHWDGQRMSWVDLGTDAGFLWGLAGSGPNDIWAWGEQAVLHYQR